MEKFWIFSPIYPEILFWKFPSIKTRFPDTSWKKKKKDQEMGNNTTSPKLISFPEYRFFRVDMCELSMVLKSQASINVNKDKQPYYLIWMDDHSWGFGFPEVIKLFVLNFYPSGTKDSNFGNLSKPRVPPCCV
jgi:hypothetical protein